MRMHVQKGVGCVTDHAHIRAVLYTDSQIYITPTKTHKRTLTHTCLTGGSC